MEKMVRSLDRYHTLLRHSAPGRHTACTCRPSAAKPRLVACCSIQLAQREGDAATLVAANENQVAEMAKLTALLRTIDSVCVASSMHLHSPLHSESQTLPSRAHAAVLFVSIRSTLLNDHNVGRLEQELKAVSDELGNATREKAELATSLDAAQVRIP